MRGITQHQVRRQSRAQQGRGGVSAEARSYGFLPAFLDRDNGEVYLSRHANGQLASIHILAGLPDELVMARSAGGRVLVVKPSLVAGFVRHGCFYTREEAGHQASSLPPEA